VVAVIYIHTETERDRHIVLLLAKVFQVNDVDDDHHTVASQPTSSRSRPCLVLKKFCKIFQILRHIRHIYEALNINN